ncbi:MAG: FeoA family protein [Syntrophomonadaceae bacterium]|nr:ferrous iron transport protein A [Syntrophomonadaceae bacterium]MDH7497670.1 FeoA family protein [Syntrophomonadaceae bacterium]
MSPRGRTEDQQVQLTLDRVPTGGRAEVLDVRGGWSGHRRLMGLGIRPGAVLEVVSRHPLRGPIVVRLNGCQIALGRGLAHRVLVRPR